MNKIPNMADWIESRIHLMFTELADNLFGDNRITRDERIALSGAIGTSLDAFHTVLQSENDLRLLHQRSPWDIADPAEGEWQRSKAGRRLSAKQLQRLQEAQRTIADLVSWANYESEQPDDDDDESPKSASIGAVKALGNGRIGGYAVLWGSAAKRDLTGEFFTTKTAELTKIFDAMQRLPLLYHHGADNKLASTVVGPVDVMKADDVGLWYEAQLEMAGHYREAIEGLIAEGLLGTSSGTLPAGRRVNRRSGEITRWPIAELSLTPTPAEPRMMERPVAEIKAAYRALGFDEESLERAVNNGSYAQPADTDTGAENARPEDGDLAQIKQVQLETERLALLKLRR